MDCALIQPDLIAYHLAEIEDPARVRVEAHLASCPRCLQDFFALKRSLEAGDVVPSAAAKVRLRGAVAVAVERAQPRKAWSWWERPLAVGFAITAVALATFATVSLAASPASAPHGWAASTRP